MIFCAVGGDEEADAAEEMLISTRETALLILFPRSVTFMCFSHLDLCLSYQSPSIAPSSKHCISLNRFMIIFRHGLLPDELPC